MDNNNDGINLSTRTGNIAVNNDDNKSLYSAQPASPATTPPTTTSNYSPVSGMPTTTSTTIQTQTPTDNNNTCCPILNSHLSTPKKFSFDSNMLKTIREKLKSPGGVNDLQLLECNLEPVNVVKDRYLIITQPTSNIQRDIPNNGLSNPLLYSGRSAISYRRFIDLASTNLKCTDVFTEEEFQCKIINEPYQKVQTAYMRLKNDDEFNRSTLELHALIRGVHDIVPLSSNRTYVIIKAQPNRDELLVGCAGGKPTWANDDDDEEIGVYEDLHSYVRDQRGLEEGKARYLFHQICQTVMLCHRNGIILRDLKLKRFYFIDKARTKLQYESLEGCMILDNPDNDLLSEKVGCPLYTAPELLCPYPTYHGKPADMWSLGVILYTMIVGQYPFYEKGNHTLITIIRHTRVNIPAFVPKSVKMLIFNLLHKEYAERIHAGILMYMPWLRECKPNYLAASQNLLMATEQMEQMVEDDINSNQQHKRRLYDGTDNIEYENMEYDDDNFDDDDCERLIVKYAKKSHDQENDEPNVDYNSHTFYGSIEYDDRICLTDDIQMS